MQWWLWIVIWLALALALVGTLAFFGWRLVQKGMAVLAELEQLTDKVAALQENVETLSSQSSRSAILEGYAVVATRRDGEKARRTRMRELRRDRRLERGRLITAPHAWEGRTDAR